MSYPSPFQYISEKDAKDIEEVKRKLAELGAESERLMDTNVISSKGQTLMSELIWHIATGNISPTTLAPILIHTEIFQSIETNNDDDGAGFNRTRKVASWFLYADKGNIIAEKWRKGVDAFWEAPVKRLQYFWFHDLFGEIYTKDTEFKTAWDKSLKYIANYDPIAESSVNPCWFVPYSPDRWKQIEPESLDGPCYKLTHGTSDVLMKSTSVMRLFNYESKLNLYNLYRDSYVERICRSYYKIL